MMAVGTRVTAQAFLALPESNQLRELINGEIVVNPPKDGHQVCAGNLYFYLRQHVPDGRVRIAPTGLYVDEANIVEPDVFWVSAANPRCDLHDDGYWRGAPNLIAEVLSPSTMRNDRVTKFQLYERLGVREYWLVEVETPSVEVWTLVDGQFSYQGTYALGQAVTVDALLLDDAG